MNLDLFTVPYQKHSQTSKDSAMNLPNANTLEERVYKCLLISRGGMTDEKIQTTLNMNPSTQRPRRVRLVEKGLVIDSGMKRKTRSGRNAVVWRVV